MRQFYMAYPRILQTASAKSGRAAPSDKLPFAEVTLRDLGKGFPLSWSHYVRLLSVEKPEARAFYEAEALRGGWSIRQLDRQIGSQFYERTLLSRNKAAMLRKGSVPQPGDLLTPEEEIKDPLVLEFLNLTYGQPLVDAATRHAGLAMRRWARAQATAPVAEEHGPWEVRRASCTRLGSAPCKSAR